MRKVPHRPAKHIPHPKHEKPSPLSSWRKKVPILLDKELDTINEKLVSLRGEEEKLNATFPALPEEKVPPKERETYTIQPPQMNSKLQEKLFYIHQELSTLDKSSLESGKKITAITTKKKWYRPLLAAEKKVEQSKKAEDLPAEEKGEQENITLKTVDDELLTKRLFQGIVELQEKWKEIKLNVERVRLRRGLKKETIQHIETELAKLSRQKQEKVKVITSLNPSKQKLATTDNKVQQELQRVNRTLSQDTQKPSFLKRFSPARKQEYKPHHDAQLFLNKIKEEYAPSSQLAEIEQKIAQLDTFIPPATKMIKEIPLPGQVRKEKELLQKELTHITHEISQERKPIHEKIVHVENKKDLLLKKRLHQLEEEIAQLENSTAT